MNQENNNSYNKQQNIFLFLKNIYLYHIRGYLVNIINYLILFYIFLIPFDFTYGKSVKALFILWIFIFPYKTIIEFIKYNIMVKIIFVFSLLLLSSFVWGENDSTNPLYGTFTTYGKNFFYFFLIPILIIGTTFKKGYAVYAMVVYVISILLNSLLSFGIMFDVVNIQGKFTTLSSSYNPIAFQSSHIPYSVMIAFSILLLISLIIQTTNKYMKIFYIIAMLLSGVILFFLQGRTGQFSLVLALLSLSIIYLRKYKKYFISSLLILIVIVTTMYTFNNRFYSKMNLTANNFINVFTKKDFTTSIGTRIGSYYLFPYLIKKENILFGVGVGAKENYVKEIAKDDFPYRVKDFDRLGRLDNTYLEIILSNGIVGFIFMLMMFFFIIYFKYNNTYLMYTGYVVFFMLILTGLSVDIWAFWGLKVLFGAFIGVLLAGQRKKSVNI